MVEVPSPTPAIYAEVPIKATPATFISMISYSRIKFTLAGSARLK